MEDNSNDVTLNMTKEIMTTETVIDGSAPESEEPGDFAADEFYAGEGEIEEVPDMEVIGGEYDEGDMMEKGGMYDGEVMPDDMYMEDGFYDYGEMGAEMGMEDGGASFRPMSSMGFIIGIYSAVLVVGIGLGILFAKLKARKGLKVYED